MAHLLAVGCIRTAKMSRRITAGISLRDTKPQCPLYVLVKLTTMTEGRD